MTTEKKFLEHSIREERAFKLYFSVYKTSRTDFSAIGHGEMIGWLKLAKYVLALEKRSGRGKK